MPEVAAAARRGWLDGENEIEPMSNAVKATRGNRDRTMTCLLTAAEWSR